MELKIRRRRREQKVNFCKLLLMILVLSLIAVGCFRPKVVPEVQECKLYTKKLTLVFPANDGADILVSMFANSCAGNAELCLAGVLAIPVSSLIVSGSIVVVGNTLHWIEQQGRCEDSIVRKYVNNLIETGKTIGGVTIRTGKELIERFEKHIMKNN